MDMAENIVSAATLKSEEDETQISESSSKNMKKELSEDNVNENENAAVKTPISKAHCPQEGSLPSTFTTWRNQTHSAPPPKHLYSVVRRYKDEGSTPRRHFRHRSRSLETESSGFSPKMRLSQVGPKLKHWRSLQNSRFLNFRKNRSPIQSSFEDFKSFIKKHTTTLPPYDVEDLITLKSVTGFMDSHCHLDFLFDREEHFGSYDEYQQLNEDTFPECYKGCIAVFCDPKTFKLRVLWENILKTDYVWAAFGCHPHHADKYDDIIHNELRTALKHPKVRALGEIGLDYSPRNSVDHDVQKETFIKQLTLAKELKLPLVIHLRDSYDDGLFILKQHVPKTYFLHIHCFCGHWYEAQQIMNAFPNSFLGFTNIVTYPAVKHIHNVVKKIDLNRLLLETDAPYFWPQRVPPTAKRVSHPGMAIHVAAQIAAFRGISTEEVLNQTYKNTVKMYGLQDEPDI